MHFTRLRLTGFKSFVDQTELSIEPGVTGIVGPNGCGKSNLVEALRWVMGETSAKRMRGDDMDDVIFAGSAARPARNIAEVTLGIDNTSHTAPAGFNATDELEVSRRIERGTGSDYRINGKLARARDVQLLFADNAAGASSPALVSQGKVSQIIAAKPSERRSLLEEAAGITGLHARRHEAETRLKAAEANLLRLEDVIGAMDGQLQALRRQSRQAERYRDLSDQIRRAEAALWFSRWRDIEVEDARARAAHAAADALVATTMRRVADLAAVQSEAATSLARRRKEDADAAADLHRLVITREHLDAEMRRVTAIQDGRRRSLGQLADDLNRETALARDATATLDRLAAEGSPLRRATADEALASEAAQDALALVEEQVEALDRELARLTELVAGCEARRADGLLRLEDLGQRLAAIRRQRTSAGDERTVLSADTATETALARAGADILSAERDRDEAATAADTAEHERERADTAMVAAREDAHLAQAAATGIEVEAEALRALLHIDTNPDHPPVVDGVSVHPGFEAAFAAAFRDDLNAPVTDTHPIGWRILTAYHPAPPTPGGTVPLSQWVEAPPALARALALIGVVDTAAEADALMVGLTPGQTLVSRDGGLWRWDGFRLEPGAPTPAAIRLGQKNRLRTLESERERAKAVLATALEKRDLAKSEFGIATGKDRQTRDALRHAFDRLAAAKDLHARLTREAATRQSRLSLLDDACARLDGELGEIEAARSAAEARFATLPDPEEHRAHIATLRQQLGERRIVLTERRSARDRLIREAETRRDRLAQIAREEAAWQARAAGAAERIAAITARTNAETAEAATLADRPAAIAAERQALQANLGHAEKARADAARHLTEAELQLAAGEQQQKRASDGLADAREARAKAEAAVTAALRDRQTVSERIAERLGCQPEHTATIAGFSPGEAPPAVTEVQSSLDRLTRERDAMGPVNLRAALEAGELAARVGSLETERADLTAAIGRLRHGIGALNREARERLVAAFDVVNRDFQSLFSRLFGGGKADLQLVNAEDPLEAGIEIFASPPGKRLQILTLLSGGEQALTALSLLFAVFRSNPAPICVLDEVDAPLDEANVARFCDLIEDIAAEGRTRFLVITHHRLTMARVHRLYGVTMAERGISQLVSVSLDEAEDIAETEPT